MFLHTYAFATNRIPLVLEELSLCRNLHQIQVERTEKAPLRKAQKQRGERSPTREQNMGQPTIAPRPKPSRQLIARRRGQARAPQAWAR
jgi:hypothetical protein